MWHKAFASSVGPGTPSNLPLIIPRSEHSISRAQISSNALKVLYRLRGAGQRACLVGGGVRDLLLGCEPKDFDIATDAHPEQVHGLFRNCRLIGRRFRLAHIHFGQEVIEVATFRASSSEDEDTASAQTHLDRHGRIISDNVYGSIEEDARRRDFTINALYYDIDNFSVLDYAGGLEDLQAGVIRLIGQPEQRYREDPVRMLRAVRFAGKLGFRIHPDTQLPLLKLGHLLEAIPPARLFDEVLKLFLGGNAVQTFELLRHYRLFGHLFPATERCLSRQSQHYPKTLLIHALTNTDARIAEDKPVTPSFLFAALLWEPLQDKLASLNAVEITENEMLEIAADQVIQAQLRHIALPRRFSIPLREIWGMQSRFANRAGRRPARLVLHPRFRAAYDFLLLRAEVDDSLAELAQWWTDFVASDDNGRQAAMRVRSKSAVPNRSHRKRAPRRQAKPSIAE